ncbi:hypothetical protein BCR33DRAFT_549910 [Rhizoclosmatium globosum]|uniref:Methyltransferase domain-containing protein n=1 Tax=Rhizoclosmatium globosum TaxID=329046 RepID=A0A1Y2B8V5_9FUNG|nr:hypothetical protein BCR33DRAFT_549910 [Rhizoclosmatium globosum]|eukprot:ORY31126.1 hypothetical protein BCR33DRAFT_549910 [Rhizoclosmatium globosum]
MIANPPDLSWYTSYTNTTPSEAEDRIQTTYARTAPSHHVYKCIQNHQFATPRGCLHPLYDSLKPRFKAGESVLELGCCFGTDARRFVQDGVDVTKLVVSDLHDAYFRIGGEVLYSGDTALDGVGEWWGDLAVLGAAEKAGLKGRFGIVSAQAILHVLSKGQVAAFLRECLACLQSGGVLYGMCVGSRVEGEWGVVPTKGLEELGREVSPRYLHSRESLEGLLRGVGFSDVVVNAVERGEGEDGRVMAHLIFSGKREQ